MLRFKFRSEADRYYETRLGRLTHSVVYLFIFFMRTVSSQEKEYTLEKTKPRARLFLRNREKGKYTNKCPHPRV